MIVAKTQEEIRDLILKYHSKFDTQSGLAKFIGSSNSVVSREFKKLIDDGLIAKRPVGRKSVPHEIGKTAVLVAKTCPVCCTHGEILPADWFYIENGYWHKECKRCYNVRKESSRIRDSRSDEFLREMKGLTEPFAERTNKRFEEWEKRVFQDDGKSILEKALETKRTYASVSNAISRLGYVSRQPMGDPEQSKWRIVFPS